MAKGVFRGLALGATASLLVACGGGGGGGGSDGGGNSPLVPNPAETLKLTFSADRTSLPLNIAGDAAAIGSPYTSTINLRGSFVPGGGTEGGNCWSAEFNIISGAASGFLVPPSLTGATSGVATFFTSSSSGNWKVLLNATDKAGTVTIEVAVPNPNTATVTCNDDKIEIGARFAGTPISYIREQFQIQVGGGATGRPAQVVVTRQAANFLYAQGLNGPTQMVLQATIVDEAGQRVPDTANALRARIVSDPNSGADDTARLLFGAANVPAGEWVSSSSINGQAQFSVRSGNRLGVITIEVEADRADNNVANGVAEPISNVAAIPVVSNNPLDPLAITTTALTDAYVGATYAGAIAATGATAPYSWSLASDQVLPALPPGMSLDADGALSGTPTAAGSFTFTVEATDSALQNRSKVSRTFTLTVLPALAITTTSLPSGTEGVPYAAQLQASGGKAPYTWSGTGAGGLSISAAGVVSGTPSSVPDVGANYILNVIVTDANGKTATRNLTVTVIDVPAP